MILQVIPSPLNSLFAYTHIQLDRPSLFLCSGVNSGSARDSVDYPNLINRFLRRKAIAMLNTQRPAVKI